MNGRRTYLSLSFLPILCATYVFAMLCFTPLQIKSSGEMVSELDLPRQKPYECLLLGFIPPEAAAADSEVQ